VQVSEAGQARKVVLVKYEQARKYAEWLTGACVEGGRLPRPEETDLVMEIRPKMNRSFARHSLPENLRDKDVWPFNLEVRAVPFGRLVITSEPSGARVYVDGEEVGLTPWEGEIAPGLVSYVIEKEGFQRKQGSFTLGDKEQKEFSVKLKQNAGVVFGQEWENSLGMKFVPLGEDLMVAIWETRVSDYQRYAKATKKELRAPGFEQKGNEPVVYVSRDDAEAFCEWLTKQERGQRLQNNHRYRLPTDAEWSRMVGLREFGEAPNQNDVDERTAGLFPWGAEWPLPEKAGNYAGREAASVPGILANKTIQGYEDPFARTAPVGSFPANEFGIHDLGGNVQEWVADSYSPVGHLGVTRGGSWNSFQREHLESHHRNALRPDFKGELYGFRVVLVKNEVTERPADDSEESEDE
ncbi:MAG: SUMF1/EgtB/PvdO family nonheme iron enzyme, partial [Verrucomicrobiales bacterium]